MATLLRFAALGKSYGIRDVFQQLQGEINSGDVIGLTGDNGCGKSTLLRILVGVEQPSAGTVSLLSGTKVAYLPQELIAAEGEIDVFSYVRNGLEDVVKLEQELRRLERAMEADSDQQLLQRYGDLLAAYERLSGYTADARVEIALDGVGLPRELWTSRAKHLSGGEQTRVALARVIVTEPNLLLLDEPTNYLDFAGLDWLEKWVKGFAGAILLVSHDRYFLDRVANQIWELERGELRCYVGTYSAYRVQREQEIRQQLAAYERDQAEKRRLQEVIAKQSQWFQSAHRTAGQNDFLRARAKKSAARAKATVTRLEKLLEEAVAKPWEEDDLGITFTATEHSSQNLIVAEDVSFSYGTVAVLEGVNFHLRPGERVAIVGENGSGKTTLLRLLLQELSPQRGQIAHSPSLSVGYFSQERDDLNPQNTLLQEMLQIPGLTRSEAWLILARLGFRQEAVHQLVAEVSLGQRARVSLAKLLVSAHNVLVLDEPTNHLDIRSSEKIEEALQDYPGALVLVSHDRYFLDKVVNQVYHLDNRRLTLYLGNYSQFVAQRQADPVAAARRRQETILRTRLAALAARLASLSPEDAEYSELDEEYRQVTSQLRQVSE